MDRKGRAAFSLIELLIVVGIISILATIAVPNFLEAQIRVKVTRVQSDLHLLATGLEAYYIDHIAYPPAPIPFYEPPDKTAYTWFVTTPIPYLSAVPRDFFAARPVNPDPETGGTFGLDGMYLHYLSDPENLDEFWLLFSNGPDCDMDLDSMVYDPSNGTLSNGNLFLSAGSNR